MEKFSKNLRRYREKAGYKAKDFAELLGMKYTSYTAYENQNREPKLEVLCQIADLLYISTDKLLGHKIKNDERQEYEQWKRRLKEYGFEVDEENNGVIIVSYRWERWKGEELIKCSLKYPNQKSFILQMEMIESNVEGFSFAVMREGFWQFLKREVMLRKSNFGNGGVEITRQTRKQNVNPSE